MNNGFTLVELLVVVLIIGILSAVALPQYQTAVERARATEALTQMNAVRTSMERYHAQHESFPSGFSSLDVDLPCRTFNTATSACAEFGGKYFKITASGGTINAARVGGEAYTLTTAITATDSGYSSTRSCSPRTGTGAAVDYCNAISGGHPEGF